MFTKNTTKITIETNDKDDKIVMEFSDEFQLNIKLELISIILSTINGLDEAKLYDDNKSQQAREALYDLIFDSEEIVRKMLVPGDKDQNELRQLFDKLHAARYMI